MKIGKAWTDHDVNEKIINLLSKDNSYDEVLGHLKVLEQDFLSGRHEEAYPVEINTLNSFRIVRDLIELMEEAIHNKNINDIKKAV